jgi:hypothetical protein
MRLNKKRVLAGATTFGVVGAVAVAGFLADGTGPGRGKIGNLTPITVTAGPAPGLAGQALPGNSGSISFNITNPNSADLEAYELENSANVLGLTAPCAAEYISVPGNNVLPTPVPIPVGTTNVVVPDAYSLANNAPAECAGQEFTTVFTVKARTP